MTEAEWLTCEDPPLMLRLPQEKDNHRGLWFYAAACCEHGLLDLPEQMSQLIRRVAQGVGERSVTPIELWLYLKTAQDWKEQFVADQEFDRAGCIRDWQYVLVDQLYPKSLDEFMRVVGSGGEGVHQRGYRAANWAIGHGYGRDGPVLRNNTSKNIRLDLDLLRDLFGNPFRPVAVGRAERTPTVLALAELIHNDRAFDRLPILGDALEDAGCTNAAILDHCRSAGVHVRGCWLLDLILART
jgi:hypothetical protein